uniref:Putative phospholipase B-like lamina ancestor n=2 Tax=Drosophila melanogaster TaxID=7227 RepID=PLBL_DROME|nr:lamina ancestor, isoform D [Drosophila melanogaster]NP_523933.3 lamina ancestor, isoform B [Drosophila melanogaster]NP_729059.2 lamina ancestor, isoform A [Drosophila melanogaster]NP_729060.2 lamina ancestor, isoform C [Drosophila melanogaster]Q9VRK8.3 RecName: Full=Putative phospholipase B-like lamina ancestor; Flags: Precursor [Drosophila melanogaster]AAF50787.3 lamina ancestor, isoform B [Drosophila melanogaster]AAG22333.2 lamina ancestor, isoform A [Drosophila melanogaster]AAN12118.2 |eukprot:NP_001261440.1 lamina ancestor, isoform D [Drosophila melanogaster]
MLKVVGASWQKTRIGTYILIGAGLLVIGAFFIGYMERPEYDGTYCATALWTKQVGFQIENWKQQNDLVNIPTGVGRICYKDSVYENGWAQIEVETQRTYPDWVQAYAAGMLEGSLTWRNIYNQWSNTISSSCERDESTQKFCGWLRDLLTTNYHRLKRQTEKAENDHYWHQLHLFITQLEGLETGYKRGASRARSDLEEEIPFSDFLLMNAAADIQDLKIYYENYELQNSTEHTEEPGTDQPKNFFLPSATMLTKIVQEEESPQVLQLLFGHSTAGSYSSMLRIQKRYKFHYHFSSKLRSNTVPGVDITFTGYPGILGSTDDFYTIKGRHLHAIVGGVGIKNENLQLWKTVDPKKMVPLVARVMAANRISQNRQTWASAMSRHPFTGAKQWITVDLNKMKVQDNLYNVLEGDDKHDDAPVVLNEKDRTAIQQRHDQLRDMVWIAEQLPGMMTKKDVTQGFLVPGNTSWLANGVPYFKNVLELSGVNYSEDQQLTVADEEELTSLASVDKYLRTHGFRGDLLGSQESIAYGNIDLKLFSYNARLGISDFHAFAGPVFLRFQHTQPRTLEDEGQDGGVPPAASMGDERLSVSIEDADSLAEMELITERRSVRNDMRAIAMRKIGSGPFKWSEMSPVEEGGGHEGHPDEWNFDKVSPKWAW